VSRELATALLVVTTPLGCASSGSNGSKTATSESSCPASVPKDGGTCSPMDGGVLACEYGGNANGACTTFARCATPNASTPLHWIVSPAAQGCAQNGAACPATYGSGEGAMCPAMNLSCDYAEGRCACLACAPDGGVQNGYTGGYWHCRAWNDVAAGCPTPRPRLGSECSAPEGVVCDYGQCCGGPSLGPSALCAGGVWREYASGGCACAIRLCP
jgi:hypothetical protein